MLRFRGTFETEKNQLQELNNRLAQYLSRTKQLENENAYLIKEINKIRQARSSERENRYKAEMRELRRMVGQLSFEKSRAEVEREKLRQEFQMMQARCREETVVCKDIGSELKCFEKELQSNYKNNESLEQRLLQLENEYKYLEEAHRQELAHLRSQVHSRVLPVVSQIYQGPPVYEEDVEKYAHTLSEGWVHTVEMYQQQVDGMEQSIKADRAKLDDLQREKMLFISELEKLRAEAEKQSKVQIHLEDQVMQMQEKFRMEFTQYQMIIEELEHERNMLADGIEEKMRQHQHLLQVKMDLGMEVATYRALLENERIDVQEAQRRMNQHQRERVIEIKMPPQPYTSRASTSTRQHLDVRRMEQTSSLRRSPVPLSGSMSPSRVIPISVSSRAQNQSPASRRDMISFTKAKAAATEAAKSTDKPASESPHQNHQDAQKKVAEEKSVKSKEVSKQAAKEQISPAMTAKTEAKPVGDVSPPVTGPDRDTKKDTKKKVRNEKMEKGEAHEVDGESKGETQAKLLSPREKKSLDSMSVEEIIDKVMKPTGLDGKANSSGDSNITYHVEKTEQDDGTTKTQIIVESKVEEEVDISEDSALDDLLNRGVKKVSLEDIKDTATGSMIQNLLSGLKAGDDLGNKSVNVEIIEEPVDSHSDDEYGAEQKSTLSKPSSTFFHIEELENVPHDSKVYESVESSLRTSKTSHGRNGSVQVHEVCSDSDSHHDQESQDYFVSTPDDNMSEPEDGAGITSYGHYGAVDDLSDERYYQDDEHPKNRMTAEKSHEYKFVSDDDSFVKESFPECIIEEEVHVSPTVQESMLNILREDSLDPKDQLKGALEKLQESVSGPLKDELAFLTRASHDNSQNLAVNVKKVEQSRDSGTTTITAELNVSQTLEDSGLLEGEDLSDDQILAALRSSNPEFQMFHPDGAEGGHSLRFSRGDDDFESHDGMEVYTAKRESNRQVSEKHMKLEPSEKSFTFQMGINNGQADTSAEHVVDAHTVDPKLNITHEKRVATIYLESSKDDQ